MKADKQAPRILLVEDDEFFLLAVQGLLEGEGMTVTVALDGKQATGRLEANDFDCIVSDLQMPAMGGMELAKWACENRPNIPIIMMTGFTDSIATLDVLGGGAVNILYKPFSDTELVTAVNRCLARPLETPLVAGKIQGLCQIPVHSLRIATGTHAEFNLYRAVNGAPYKIVSRGELISDKIRTTLQNEILFTEAENLAKLMPINMLVAKAVAKSPSIDPAKKAEIIRGSMELLYQKIDFTGLDDQTLAESHQFIECFLQAIDNDEIWKLISNIERNCSYLLAHSLASTAFALMIARTLKLQAEECFKIATVGMFHDIGMLEVDPALTSSSPSLLSMAQRTALQKHIEFSIRSLKKAQNVPNEICEIIFQHHENCDGSGYPKKLMRQQIHPIARLIRVTDQIALFVLRSPGHPGMKPGKAVAIMEGMKELDQDYVTALESVFHHEMKKSA